MNMEKEIISKIGELIEENNKLKSRLNDTENQLNRLKTSCDILFPLLFGMYLVIILQQI